MNNKIIHESLDGKAINWLEKVSDAEYLAGLGSLADHKSNI